MPRTATPTTDLVPESREAEHGQKMIEVKIRFWTDAIATAQGQVVPKHGWTSGVVRIKSNPVHGFVDHDPIIFNTLAQVPAKIEELLIREGIVLRPTARTRRYQREA
jgi:hypothetical protein